MHFQGTKWDSKLLVFHECADLQPQDVKLNMTQALRMSFCMWFVYPKKLGYMISVVTIKDLNTKCLILKINK